MHGACMELAVDLCRRLGWCDGDEAIFAMPLPYRADPNHHHRVRSCSYISYHAVNHAAKDPPSAVSMHEASLRVTACCWVYIANQTSTLTP